jgi:hypothetical protein
MAYNVSWEDHGFIVNLASTICASDFISINESLFCDRRFDDLVYIIFDLKNVTQYTLSDDDLEKIGAPSIGAATWKKNLLITYVTRDQQLSDLISRHFTEYGVLYGSWKYKIFSEISSARAYISTVMKKIH